MVGRRTFIARTAFGGFGLYLLSRSGVRLLASIPGGTLDPGAVPKFTTPLLIPPAMPRAAKLRTLAERNIDYYEIAVRQFSQQVLPAGFPPTTVWGYGPAVAQGGPLIFNAPSLTIEAKIGTPVRVRWINELVNPAGGYLPHLLPVDQTLHWANPPGGTAGRDTRPAFATTPGRYGGPVPLVTHVHGAVSVGDESDGYAEAWFLPAANDIPAGYATEGTWYGLFAAKAAALGFTTPGQAGWVPGSAVYQYPNSHRARTLWYHDHSLGMTRLNVYAGPAGFFLLRGGPSDLVLDARRGRPATLPGPAPAIGDPAGVRYYEIPLAIQDRSFNTDGSLFYPDSRAFFDEIAGPYAPETDIAPIWNPEFFGNMMMVNGHTWPTLDVEQRRYRFRLLNGCNSRFLILDFNAIANVKVWQIGNEGGFLAAPVDMTAVNGNRILMAPAERADVIVDFTNVPIGRHVLGNVGPDEPFGGGAPGDDFDVADPDGTGQVLQFNVVALVGRDASTPPQFLRLPAVPPPPATSTTRPLALFEEMSATFEDAPAAALLATVDDAGRVSPRMWADPITENPTVGQAETWEFYNTTGDAHPIHIHETTFRVVNREGITVEEPEEESMADRPVVALVGNPRDPEPWERGLKDTVITYPGEVTRVLVSFDTPGRYAWHCHIVEHEDNEMMRPFGIEPEQPVTRSAGPPTA